MYSFVEKVPNCLPKWLYHFAFPPAVNERKSKGVSTLRYLRYIESVTFQILVGMSEPFGIAS